MISLAFAIAFYFVSALAFPHSCQVTLGYDCAMVGTWLAPVASATAVPVASWSWIWA